MRIMNFKFPVVLITLALGFSACQKVDSLTESSTSGIKLQAINKSFTLPVDNSTNKSASVATASIVWDTTLMVVSSIKFEAETKSVLTYKDSIKIDYKWNGPQVIDLFDTTITLGDLMLQPGLYDEIELKVEGSKGDANGNPVFYLHGFYTPNDSVKLPVMVIVNEDISFKTERDSVEITAANASLFSSTILLYLDQLMVDIQPAALDKAKLINGNLIISADSNIELYRIIMRNLGRDQRCKHGQGYAYGHDKEHGNDKNKGNNH
jgi:hypothetical protein